MKRSEFYSHSVKANIPAACIHIPEELHTCMQLLGFLLYENPRLYRGFSLLLQRYQTLTSLAENRVVLLGRKALTVCALILRGIAFVSSDADRLERAVILSVVVVFAACNIADNAVVCVACICHNYHLVIIIDSAKTIIHLLALQ